METNLCLDAATFRQLAVLMAMQGLLANSDLAWPNNDPYRHIAGDAVKFADALLEAMTVDSGDDDDNR